MRKEQVDNTPSEPWENLEFEAGDNKEYKIEIIINSVIYSQ